MKKYLFFCILAIISFIIVAFIACDKDHASSDPDPEIPQVAIIELGNLTPFVVDISENNSGTIGFIQSAIPFNIDLNNVNGNKYLNTIKIAQGNGLPIKVFIYEGTDQIVAVEPVSQEEIEVYKKTFIAPIETKETMPTIPYSKMNSIFNEIKNSSIPFAYAVDGCYARAHKMRQIIKNNGYDCSKLFAYGSLAASNGSCCVRWVYHVAPIVRYYNASGAVTEGIIDPSLFPNGPVTRQTWLNACANKSCYSSTSITSTRLTAGSVYYAAPNGRTKDIGGVIYDNNYVNTNCVLTAYRGLSGCNTMPPSTSHCGY